VVVSGATTAPVLLRQKRYTLSVLATTDGDLFLRFERANGERCNVTFNCVMTTRPLQSGFVCRLVNRTLCVERLCS
jgi:hypothetical protein